MRKKLIQNWCMHLTECSALINHYGYFMLICFWPPSNILMSAERLINLILENSKTIKPEAVFS